MGLFIVRFAIVIFISMFRPSTAGIYQAPVVQTLDSAIHRINHYPAD